MKQKIVYYFAIITLIGIFASCGQSEEERKRISKLERIRLAREDSAAFKVAILPTLDCLPVFVAKQYQLYDTAKIDLRLKAYSAYMDCDTAFINKRVEAGITDIVRAEKMKTNGTELHYISATNAYWQLIGNRLSRIRQLKQLNDKMMAMTRYSITDMLSGIAIDSAQLKTERVFRIQINDERLRLKMLENNEMDAMWLTEPQATAARMQKHHLLLDSRKLDINAGVVAIRKELLTDKTRKQQTEAFVKAYNQAVDSINKNGAKAYGGLIVKYCAVNSKVVSNLPKELKFNHISTPRDKDVENAKKYIQN